jgi:hypothetical protein
MTLGAHRPPLGGGRAVSDKENPLTMVIHRDRASNALLRALLDPEGYPPDTCSSLGRSLAAVQRKNPDLILLSRGMSSGASGPWMDCGEARESRSQDVRSSHEKVAKAILPKDPEEGPGLFDATDEVAGDPWRIHSGGGELLENVHRFLGPVKDREAQKIPKGECMQPGMSWIITTHQSAWK